MRDARRHAFFRFAVKIAACDTQLERGIYFETGIFGGRRSCNQAGALLTYVKGTQNVPLEHITKISRDDNSSFVLLDNTAQKNLELLSNLKGEKQGSLISVLEGASTPMGQRLLRQMIVQPLRDNNEVNRRLDLVEALKDTAIEPTHPS